MRGPRARPRWPSAARPEGRDRPDRGAAAVRLCRRRRRRVAGAARGSRVRRRPASRGGTGRVGRRGAATESAPGGVAAARHHQQRALRDTRREERAGGPAGGAGPAAGALRGADPDPQERGLVGPDPGRAPRGLRGAVGTHRHRPALLPAIARRLHHCRDLGPDEPFDFLTWFDFAPQHEPAFDQLLLALRSSPEWRYVEREVDLRLQRSTG